MITLRHHYHWYLHVYIVCSCSFELCFTFTLNRLNTRKYIVISTKTLTLSFCISFVNCAVYTVYKTRKIFIEFSTEQWHLLNHIKTWMCIGAYGQSWQLICNECGHMTSFHTINLFTKDPYKYNIKLPGEKPICICTIDVLGLLGLFCLLRLTLLTSFSKSHYKSTCTYVYKKNTHMLCRYRLVLHFEYLS